MFTSLMVRVYHSVKPARWRIRRTNCFLFFSIFSTPAISYKNLIVRRPRSLPLVSNKNFRTFHGCLIYIVQWVCSTTGLDDKWYWMCTSWVSEHSLHRMGHESHVLSSESCEFSSGMPSRFLNWIMYFQMSCPANINVIKKIGILFYNFKYVSTCWYTDSFTVQDKLVNLVDNHHKRCWKRLAENLIEKFEHLRNLSLHAFVGWYYGSHE